MNRQKILIIEDDPAMVLYYTFALETEYDILSATSGNSAIDRINHLEDIDLVILDYKLQDMSGITVLKEIKRIKPSIPIIVITAYGDEEVAVSSFRYGAKEYIKKPVTYDELFEKITFCLSLKSTGKDGRNILFHDAMAGTQSQQPYFMDVSRNFLKIQKAVRYIEVSFMTKISLGLVSGKACMSRHHFCRIFRKAIGITYSEYLNSVRIKNAMKLLERNTLTITEVAHASGYDDITYFGRVFKRIVNSTPSEYRKVCNANTRP